MPQNRQSRARTPPRSAAKPPRLLNCARFRVRQNAHSPLMYKHWLLAIRPKTLSLAVAPVLVGTFMAVLDIGDLRWPVAVAALLAAVLIQAATNLHNDAADFERGADDPATRDRSTPAGARWRQG